MMSVAKEILKQIQNITEILIRLSLCDYQNPPLLRDLGHGYCDICISKHDNLSYVLKNISYQEIYAELNRTQSYNFKMLDGAIIQMMYRLKNDKLESHRLAFFPSPNLEEFQNNPEIYLDDEIYADIIARNIVPFPLRFDFDNTCFVEIEHPESHITLGQYKNCRIPVSAPLMPSHFVIFILRNFYNTAFSKYSDKIQAVAPNIFTETITDKERELIYFHIPK
jgi:hypothetical protein